MDMTVLPLNPIKLLTARFVLDGHPVATVFFFPPSVVESSLVAVVSFSFVSSDDENKHQSPTPSAVDIHGGTFNYYNPEMINLWTRVKTDGLYYG